MGRFWYWLQRRKRINEKHCGAFCLNCKFYCDCRYGDMNRKGKVIIELPRTPANAWLFEPIENHREVVQKEKK